MVGLVSMGDGVGDTVDRLSRFGCCAPHGWSSRQSEAQRLLPLHLATHWLPHSWQMKKGSVRLYSEMLGR